MPNRSKYHLDFRPDYWTNESLFNAARIKRRNQATSRNDSAGSFRDSKTAQ